MKYLFLFFLLFVSFFANSQRSNVIYTVRSVDADNGKVMVTFWEDNQVYRFEKNSKVLPCLENAYKAKMKVDLVMNKRSDVIEDCKLAGGGFPKE